MPPVTYTGPKDSADPSTRVRVPGVGVYPLNVPVPTDDEHVDTVLAVEGHEFVVGDGDAAPALTGAALNKRGAELEIEGFASLTADEKRDAIAKAEAADPDPDGGDQS